MRKFLKLAWYTFTLMAGIIGAVFMMGLWAGFVTSLVPDHPIIAGMVVFVTIWLLITSLMCYTITDIRDTK